MIRMILGKEFGILK